jgi:gliding motility-associated lipoprotein GldH
MHKFTFHFLVGLATVILCNLSCTKPYYSKKINFPNENWTYQQPLEFKWTIQDTLQPFDLILSVEHEDQMKFQNVYVRCRSSFPDTTDRIQEVSLELLDPTGKPYGKCSLGTCTAEIPLLVNTVFPKTGEYGLIVEQYSRMDSFPGMKSIQLDILKRK